MADHMKASWGEYDAAQSRVARIVHQEAASPESPFADFILKSFHASVPVPPGLTMRLLQPKLAEARKLGIPGILLDGFPRSIEQLTAFEEQVIGLRFSYKEPD